MGVFALVLALTLPVAEVTGERDTGTRRYPGRIVPVAQVNVVPQVSGEILEVGFSNGQSVRKGDLLYRLDSVKYEMEWVTEGQAPLVLRAGVNSKTRRCQ